MWIDGNRNGNQDSGELGTNLAGMTVHLLQGNNQPVLDPATGQPITGITDTDGIATLEGVPANRHFRLRFDPVAGYRFTALRSAAANRDNDAGGTGYTTAFRADRSAQLFTDIDAGVYAIDGITKQGPADVVATQPTTVQEAIVVKVFPNPTVDQLNVSFTNATEGLATLRVMDVNGREAARQQYRVYTGENQLRIEVADLPQGTYFLEVRTEQQAVRKTFIKQ